MFEAIPEEKSVSSQAVGALAVEYWLWYLATLPALAEESDPSISSQPFSGWILSQRSLSEDHISYARQ